MLNGFLKQWYYNISIKKKLTLFYGGIIIISLFVLTLLANKVSSDIVVSKTIDSSVKNLALIEQGLDSLFGYMEDVSKTVIINQEVQTLLTNDEDTEELELYREKQNATSHFDDLIEPRTVISSILVFGNNGQRIGSTSISVVKLERNEDLRQRFEKAVSNDKMQYLDTHEVTYELGKEKVNCISLIRQVFSSKDSSKLGFFEINVNEEKVSGLFSALQYRNTGNYFIINNDGKVISALDKSLIYMDVSKSSYFNWVHTGNRMGKLFDIQGKKSLVTFSRYAVTNWIIIGIVPYDELVKDNKKVTELIFIIGFILVVIALWSSVAISKTITSPIIKLTQIMSEVGKGNLKIRAEVMGNDEVSYLSKSFNTMIDEISGLIDKVYMEQKKKREYELIALQAQINPHFLYNTLNSISSLAMLKRTDETLLAIKSLANFYSIVLSKGQNIIPIEEEIENVKSYLTIQKIRYSEKFDYDIDIDSKILECKIIKLSIQPLVENSIKHGIRKLESKGHIEILGRITDEMVVISVIDNGVGFDENKIFKLLEINGSEQSGSNSFGIRSVDERIKLYFGDKYGLFIDYSRECGAAVEIHLPYERYTGPLNTL